MKYHLIVSCVKSKYLTGPALNQVSSGSLQQVYSKWRYKLQQNLVKSKAVLAMDLYKGSVWLSSLSAFDALPEPKQLWIVSAGYGLLSGQQQITGYEATFQSGEIGSIVDQITEDMDESNCLQNWWQQLANNPPLQAGNNPRSLSELVKRYPDDRFLLVLSQKYLQAISRDLLEAISQLEQPQQFLIVSNNQDIHRVVDSRVVPYILPYSAGAEYYLKAKRLTLNGQIAQFLLKQVYPLKGWDLEAFANAIRLMDDAYMPRALRQKMTESELRLFIQDYLHSNAPYNATRALKCLRDLGQACEQKRFGLLFREELEIFKRQHISHTEQLNLFT